MDFMQQNFPTLQFKTELDEKDIQYAFLIYKEHIESSSDCFVILIHLIMLQNGFFNSTNNHDDTQFLIKNKFFSKLCYNSYKRHKHEVKFDSSLKIVINFMSSVNRIDVQAFLPDYKSDNIFAISQKVVDSDLSVKGINFKNINDAIINFKDSIVSPLKLFVYERFYHDQLSGKSLIYLPNEILLNIIKYLDIKSIMKLSEASKLFRNLICDKNLIQSTIYFSNNQSLSASTLSSNYLWKYLTKRDFAKHNLLMATCSENCNFYEKYVGWYAIFVNKKKSNCNPYIDLYDNHLNSNIFRMYHNNF